MSQEPTWGSHHRPDPGLLSLLAVAAGTVGPEVAQLLSENQVRWAVETGLGPLLRRFSIRGSPITQSATWPLVLGADLAARVESANRLEATAAILAACAGRLPPPTLLKGISLCTSVYPEPHLRPMRDVDLLVEPKDTAQLESLLAGLGYVQHERPRNGGLGHHHIPPFFHSRHELCVEVHHALFSPRSDLGCDPMFQPEVLRAERRPAELGGQPAARLSTELQLVYVAAHWGVSLKLLTGVGGLLPMLDVIFLLGRDATLRWPRVSDWLENSAAAGHVYLLLAYLERRGVLGLPPGVLERLRRGQRAIGSASALAAFRLIDRHMVQGRTVTGSLQERVLRALWRSLLLNGGPVRKLRRAFREIATG